MSINTNKHAPLNGFDSTTMEKRLASFKRYLPEGDWRRDERLSLVMTVIVQTWQYNGRTFRRRTVCPWGMKLVMQKLLFAEKCKRFNFMPSDVKQFFQITTAAAYDHKIMSISICNSGPQDIKEYVHIYCTHCKSVLSKILESHRYALGENPTIVNLVNQWDMLKLLEDKIDLVGCFLPWNSAHFARPNARRFIHNPKEHVDMCHPATNKVTTKKRQTLFSFPTKPAKVMALETPPSSSEDSTQTKIKGTWNKMTTYYTMNLFSTSIPLKGRTKITPSDFGKGVCLSMVHIGINQMISQRAIIQNYETAYEGLLSYHDFFVGLISKQPGVTIPPPVKVQLNEHNIIDAEHAIQNASRNDANSLHAKLKRSPVWSLMHDGISKFSTEYSGVYLKGIDEDLNPFDVPLCLTKLKGGVTAYDITNAIIQNVVDAVYLEKNCLHQNQTIF